MTEDILSAEDKKRVKDALEDANRLRRELQRAKRAGLDVSELEARLSEAELALRNIYNVYVAKR